MFLEIFSFYGHLFLLTFLVSTLLSTSEVTTSKIHWSPQARFLISCSNFELKSHTNNASLSVRPQVYKIKPKEDHQLNCPFSFHFYFVFHSIPTSFLFGFLFHFDYHHTWGVLQDFQKLLPLKRCFRTLHSRTSSFCCHPFFSLKPSKLLKSKFISSPPRKRSGTAGLEFRLAIH